MSRRPHFLDADDSAREQNLRFVRNADDDLEKFLGGSIGSNVSAPPRDYKVVTPKPGALDDLKEMDVRKEFFRQLGLPRHEAYEWAKRSLEMPDFDLRHYRNQRHEMRKNRVGQTSVDRRIMDEIKSNYQLMSTNNTSFGHRQSRNISPAHSRRSERSRSNHNSRQSNGTPPPPIIDNWHIYQTADDNADFIEHNQRRSRSPQNQYQHDNGFLHRTGRNRSPPKLTDFLQNHSDMRRNNSPPPTQEYWGYDNRGNNRRRSSRDFDRSPNHWQQQESSQNQIRNYQNREPSPNMRMERGERFQREQQQGRSIMQQNEFSNFMEQMPSHGFNDNRNSGNFDSFDNQGPQRRGFENTSQQNRAGPQDSMGSQFGNPSQAFNNQQKFFNQQQSFSQQQSVNQQQQQPFKEQFGQQQSQQGSYNFSSAFQQNNMDSSWNFNRSGMDFNSQQDSRNFSDSFSQNSQNSFSFNQGNNSLSQQAQRQFSSNSNGFQQSGSSQNFPQRSLQSTQSSNRNSSIPCLLSIRPMGNSQNDLQRGNWQSGTQQNLSRNNQEPDNRDRRTQQNFSSNNQEPGNMDRWTQQNFSRNNQVPDNMDRRPQQNFSRNNQEPGNMDRRPQQNFSRNNQEPGNMDRRPQQNFSRNNQVPDNMDRRPQQNFSRNYQEAGNIDRRPQQNFSRNNQEQSSQQIRRKPDDMDKKPNWQILSAKPSVPTGKRLREEDIKQEPQAKRMPPRIMNRQNVTTTQQTNVSTSREAGEAASTKTATAMSQHLKWSRDQPASSRKVTEASKSFQSAPVIRTADEQRSFARQQKLSNKKVETTVAEVETTELKRDRRRRLKRERQIRPEDFGDNIPGKRKYFLHNKSYWDNWWRQNGWVEKKIVHVDIHDRTILRDINLQNRRLLSECESTIVNSMNDSRPGNVVNAYGFLKSMVIMKNLTNIVSKGDKRIFRNLTGIVNRVNMIEYYQGIINTWKTEFLRANDGRAKDRWQASNRMNDRFFNWLVLLSFDEIKRLSGPIVNAKPKEEQLKDLYDIVSKVQDTQPCIREFAFARENLKNHVKSVTNKMEIIEAFLKDEPTITYHVAFGVLAAELLLKDPAWSKYLNEDVLKKKNELLKSIATNPKVEQCRCYILDKLINVQNQSKYLQGVHKVFKRTAEEKIKSLFKYFTQNVTIKFLCKKILQDRLRKYKNFVGNANMSQCIDSVGNNDNFSGGVVNSENNENQNSMYNDTVFDFDDDDDDDDDGDEDDDDDEDQDDNEDEEENDNSDYRDYDEDVDYIYVGDI